MLHESDKDKDKDLLHESGKDKDDASNHPGLHCCQTLSLKGIIWIFFKARYLGRICLNGVEDVDEDEEDGDEQRHSSRNHLSFKELLSD